MPDLASFVIIGAIVSLVVQVIKTYAKTDDTKTLISVVAVSLLAGGIYAFVKDTPYWQPVLNILAFAGSVYTFIIRRFESEK